MHILVDVRILLIFLYSLDCLTSVFAPFMYPRHSLKLTVLNSVSVWLMGICEVCWENTTDPGLLHESLICTLGMPCSARCKIFAPHA